MRLSLTNCARNINESFIVNENKLKIYLFQTFSGQLVFYAWHSSRYLVKLSIYVEHNLNKAKTFNLVKNFRFSKNKL